MGAAAIVVGNAIVAGFIAITAGAGAAIKPPKTPTFAIAKRQPQITKNCKI